MSSVAAPASIRVVPVVAADGARSELICAQPGGDPSHVLYWLPAMGVAAKHYLPLAEALAARGIAVALHEWRGIGSSDRRAGRRRTWGYRELLDVDLPAGLAAARVQWSLATLWIGGHSLGGQLSCVYASLHPGDVAGIALVASGSPYWRRFRFSALIHAAYALAVPVAGILGFLPGRLIGFGGNEARGVIADWSRCGRTGHYAAQGMAADIEKCLASLTAPLLALSLRDDWLGPPASLRELLGKMPLAPSETGAITPDALGGQPADHFAWMKTPHAVAARIAGWMRRGGS